MARAAAQIEGRYYCTKTRVEETVLFIKEIGAKKVGIATCFGLINEAKIFAKILQKNGIEYVSVVCQVGGEDKANMGLAPEDTISKMRIRDRPLGAALAIIQIGPVRGDQKGCGSRQQPGDGQHRFPP